jgi:uncharacterized protein YndB with AHSA1/START domain
MSRPGFIYVTIIATTPEKLWTALTEAEFIKKYWFDRQNTSVWRKGTLIESRSPEGELEWRGKVLESKPPLLLSYTFEVVGEAEPPTRVQFEIEPLDQAAAGPKGRAVRLTLTHDEFSGESEVYPDIARGWPAILSSLKTLLETGRSLELKWQE